MSLPQTVSKKENDLAKQIVLVYGRPKIGKSTLCSKFDKALFLATEPGLNQLEVFKVNVTSWKIFMETCKEIAEGKHEFRTIVIDTIDNLIPLIQAYIEETNEVDYIGDIPHGKGWFLATQELRRVLTKLAMLPYGLILVSHSKQEEIETKTKKYNRFTIDLSGKNKNAVLNLMDIILFMDSEMKGGEEIGVMRTKPSLYWEAGDKSKLLPDAIEFAPDSPEVVYDEIMKSFGGKK
jgi:hypothetical protein